ncbi:MAG TPA: DUF2202 domain-containing protein [Chitinophagaceae bacterium]|nr:DUF2202 domain-containing protein [Chitinophagaceae bacterium]
MKTLLFVLAIAVSSLLYAQGNADNEKAMVLRMREEEKMARDIYQVLNGKWDQQVFAHIAESEIYHMSQMKLWIDKFNLEDPVARNNDKRGVFTDQSLQQLYNELAASGIQSKEAAFRAGAKVEEVDILDLKKALAGTSNTDLQSTYKYLIHASENHLRAFARNLKALNIDCKPVVMDQKEFEEIIKQGAGKGQGRKAGPANGKNCCRN